MRIYYINNSHPISMSLYAARLWQYMEMIQPDWSCDSMFPLKEKIADQPNKYLRNLFDFIAYPLFLKLCLRHNRFDLFHITDLSYAYLIDYLDRQKTIATCHDLLMFKVLTGEVKYGDNQARLKLATINRNINRIKKVSHAAGIIADSINTKQDLIKYLAVDSRLVDVVYPGLNYNFHPIEESRKRAVRDSYGLKNERLILSVGNNHFYKNLEGIIEALAMKIDYFRQNNIFLMKAGSDFSESQKKMIERYGVRSQIIYVGYVSSFERLNELYNIAELFLFPSIYEGFGWPPLEAMACGTPVIASEAGSLKEVLNGAAYYIEPTNYQQIALAVIEVMEDKSICNILRDKGIANAARFDWKRAASEHIRLYTKIARAYKTL